MISIYYHYVCSRCGKKVVAVYSDENGRYCGTCWQEKQR